MMTTIIDDNKITLIFNNVHTQEWRNIGGSYRREESVWEPTSIYFRLDADESKEIIKIINKLRSSIRI
jgi:hypothetical protein